MKKICRFCSQEIEHEKQIQFVTHSATCKSNPNRGGALTLIGKFTIERNVYTFNCKKCNGEYKLTLKITDVAKGKYAKYCSDKCSHSHVMSDETRKKLSVSVKNSEKVKLANKQQRNRSHIGHHNNTVEIVETPCLYCKHPIKHRISEVRKYHSDCWKKCSGGFRKDSTIKHRSEYRGYQMDSGAELKFAKLLDEHNIKWIKNSTICFDYIGIDDKQHKYYPDFMLPEFDYWVEIKGKYYENGNEQSKLNAVGKNIELIYSNDIKLPKCCNLVH